MASEVQVELAGEEGPAAHVLRHGRLVRIHDTATHERWPLFCRQAASLGKDG